MHHVRSAEQFLLWASRHYLRCAMHGTPAPEFVIEAFENADVEWLYYALDRVLVCLLAGQACEIVVHDARCPTVALHEQALLTGLRRLEQQDEAGFTAALSAVMLPSAIRVAEPPMKLLAAGLSHMRWDSHSPVGGREMDHGTGERAPAVHDGCRSRTIN
jgi:hypothetical protein